MNVQLINFFLLLNLMVLIAGGMSVLVRYFSQQNILPLKARSELKLNYFFVALCLSFPILAQFSNQPFQFQAVAKVESAKSLKDFDGQTVNRGEGSILAISQELPKISFGLFSTSIGALVAFSLLCGIFKVMKDFTHLIRIINGSFIVRRLGFVRIAFSDQIQVPFSAKLWASWVIIPTHFLSDSGKYKISLLHELQHHRQRDTSFIYFVLIMRSLLLLNPLMWVWSRVISELQEMACDENLVDQGKVRRGEYAHRLIEIAETALNRKEQLVCAAGLAFLNDRQSISRRIESMFYQGKKRSFASKIIGAVVLMAMAGTAFAAREIVLDRRISMAEAKRMAEVAKSGSEFPIVVNDVVLKQLNRYLGTEEGRNFIRASIERMQTYRPMLDAKFSQYQMPSEILAIGIVESGYRNLPQSQNKSWGAGVWMFIESTARAFGLRVDSTVDERLNVEAETDAAMRYLTANNLRFNDWLLAIQAYNSGENAVQAAIEKNGTRDVWILLKSGLQTDKDYLARVMAVMLILKNPNQLAP